MRIREEGQIEERIDICNACEYINYTEQSTLELSELRWGQRLAGQCTIVGYV